MARILTVLQRPTHHTWAATNAQFVATAPVEVVVVAGSGMAAVGVGGQSAPKKVAAASGRCSLGLAARRTSGPTRAVTGRCTLGLAAAVRPPALPQVLYAGAPTYPAVWFAGAPT